MVRFDETYEVTAPVVSIHNVIPLPMTAPMYNDIGETMTVVNQERPQEKCEIKFEKCGWFAKEWHKLEGRAFLESSDGKS